MKNKISTDAKPANRIEFFKTAIMESLKWAELEYCNFQYEQGLEYLTAYIPTPSINNPEKAKQDWEDMLQRSRIFWNWWKNHWVIRDQQFLRIADELSLARRRAVYLKTHNGIALATDIHPNRVVMDETYAYMVHKIVKESVRCGG